MFFLLETPSNCQPIIFFMIRVIISIIFRKKIYEHILSFIIEVSDILDFASCKILDFAFAYARKA